jgi:hypothetical protein
MKSESSAARDFIKWISDRCRSFEAMDVAATDVPEMRPELMEPLKPYRCGNGIVCMYTYESTQQVAFNAVASTLPVGLRVAMSMDGGPEWTHIPADQRRGPAGVRGYIGASWKPTPTVPEGFRRVSGYERYSAPKTT